MISLSSGNEQFCTTMTQHIQSEMARLEQGLPRYDPNFTSKFKVSTERMLFYCTKKKPIRKERNRKVKRQRQEYLVISDI